MHIHNVTLEMSLKPFKKMDDEYIRTVCEKAFRQWLPLVKHADMVSVMLWTADGSEILVYKGDLDEEIEWARYIGGANPRQEIKADPEKKCLHSRWYLYTENPPVITYRGLAKIVSALKSVGRQVTGKQKIRVGATFDPGPEFAKSPFKYERHNEICFSGTMGKTSFVCCYATLKGDKEKYAGFPDGIPEGTPLGTFLGRQCRHFLTDLDLDYVWLSNGFGFGMETWATTGCLFDGKTFHPEKAGEVREKIIAFWRRFRDECPNHPIETRGTNLSTAIDLASDAVPLRDIYRSGFNLAPPPNSPWAALNGDFGFELIGYMSHIAEVPGEGFPFRFYTHDPWWLNSPWLDRYGREPHDIYLPLSVSRVDGSGVVKNPTAIEFLTIDDSYGEMPDKVPNEVIPHILAAREDAPDQPGPVVWVYPFDEYHDMTFGPEPCPVPTPLHPGPRGAGAAGWNGARLTEVFFGDWFMRAAVNEGFPLNTVVSSRNLLSSLKQKPSLYRESVLVSIVPDKDSELSRALIQHAQSGGRVLLYGPLDHAGEDLLAKNLNLRLAEPISGELDMDLRINPDELSAEPYVKKVQHRELMCAGGLRAVLKDEQDSHTKIAATVSNNHDRRIAALSRHLPAWNGGTLAWVRGTNSNSYKGGHLLTPDDPRQWFQGGLLMRFMLSEFGCSIGVRKKTPDQRNPITCIARHGNGFFFSGYTPNTTVSLRLRFPQGAPILLGFETQIESGHSTYFMPRAWHRECRVFVEQPDGEVSCVEQHSGEIGIRRRLLLRGLKDATLRFYPESGTAEKVTMLLNPAYPFITGTFIKYTVKNDGNGHHLLAEGVTGPVLISW